MKQGKVTIAGLVFGGLVLLTPSARADDVDDYTRKLMDMDERVRTMAMQFRETPAPPADLADRKLVDAQVAFALKDYDLSATILLDVVENWPNSRAHDEALFLLGEALFQARDSYSARHYLELAVAKNTGSRAEQQAMQRLVEISFRTGDYEHIDAYLARLQNLPPSAMEPTVPYVRAKYFFFRGRLDDAMGAFAAIPPNNPYYFQARYFIATIQLKRGDLGGASVAYDSILKQQAPDDAGKDIQDLCRMAIARILYERSQFDKAIEIYGTIPRQSKQFEDALREQVWTFIKAKQWQQAYRALDILLLANPDTYDGPELRLLKGNLQLRMSNFYVASDAFAKVRDEFEPIHRQLQQVIVRSQTDPTYFDSLVGKSLDKFDLSVFVPATAAKWVKAEPDVARMMALASDVGEIQRSLQDSAKLVERIQRAMQSSGRAGIFPDLASSRSKSIEVLNQEVDVRQKITAKIRAILDPILTPGERKKLDTIAIEQDGLRRQLFGLPSSEAEQKAHERTMKTNYGDLDRMASELNVQIQALEAQLVAIEQYYRTSRSEQKIRPQDIEGPVHDMRQAIDELRTLHDQVREEIADATREATAAGAAGQSERANAQKLGELLKQESEIENRAKVRLGAGDRAQVDRMGGVLARCDSVERQLTEFDKRVDGQIDLRLEIVRKHLATEKEELATANAKLGSVMDASKELGGGLAQAMFTKVADKFYDLVVRSDVGIIDVMWGLKDQKTAAVTKLTNQKSQELKALDEDFRKVLEEDK